MVTSVHLMWKCMYLSEFFTTFANSLEVDAAFTSLFLFSSEESQVLLWERSIPEERFTLGPLTHTHITFIVRSTCFRMQAQRRILCYEGAVEKRKLDLHELETAEPEERYLKTKAVLWRLTKPSISRKTVVSPGRQEEQEGLHWSRLGEGFQRSEWGEGLQMSK